MKVLVTTPNGKVGTELVRLLVQSSIPLRLGAHTPEKAQREFPGVEVVKLDYQDPASLAAAVQGVTALYIASPGDFPAAPEIALIDAAKAAGVKTVVKLSAMGVEQGDSPIRQVEKHLEASGLQWTFLRPSWFMQNFTTSMQPSIDAGTLYEPAADGKNAFIDARDIAAVAFAALTRPGHAGKAYTLTGPALLTRDEVAATFTKELGRPVKYVPIDDAQFRAAMKPHMAQSYIELLSYLYGLVRAGHTAVKTDAVKSVLGREPTGLAQFVRDHRASWK